MSEKINHQHVLIKDLISRMNIEIFYGELKNEDSKNLNFTIIYRFYFLTELLTEAYEIAVFIVELLQNATIEERVSLLEIQVVEIEKDVTGLDQDVNFLFEETIIQDERIFNLDQTSIGILGDLELVEGDIDSELINRLIYIKVSECCFLLHKNQCTGNGAIKFFM